MDRRLSVRLYEVIPKNNIRRLRCVCQRRVEKREDAPNIAKAPSRPMTERSTIAKDKACHLTLAYDIRFPCGGVAGQRTEFSTKYMNIGRSRRSIRRKHFPWMARLERFALLEGARSKQPLHLGKSLAAVRTLEFPCLLEKERAMR